MTLLQIIFAGISMTIIAGLLLYIAYQYSKPDGE